MNRNLSKIKAICCGIKTGDIRSCRVELIGQTTRKNNSHQVLPKDRMKTKSKPKSSRNWTIL
jgi:hypothetical protein